jgi:transcriptional regulator with XRE-family HTH domain
MNDRILKFLAAENISATLFADNIGVQRSGVSHILSGRNKPSFDFIEKLMRTYPKLSADWLILGSGSMYKSASNSTAPQPANTSLFAPPSKASAKTPATPPPQNSPVAVAIATSQSPATSGKEVERVAIFYTDKSVEVYVS